MMERERDRLRIEIEWSECNHAFLRAYQALRSEPTGLVLERIK